MTVPPPMPDRDSIDVGIKAGGSMRPQLDVQLKATSTELEWRDGRAGFRLTRKNYEDLRCPRQTPLILVVLQLPVNEADWMHCDAESLVIRRCAWWLSLRGALEIDTDSRTVRLRQDQRFDPDMLCKLMERLRKGPDLDGSDSWN